LTTEVNSPTVDNATHIQTALEALSEHIIKGPFAEYPPSKEELLRGIGADRRVGPGVQSRVNAILSTHGQTTAALVGQLTALQSDINSFKKTCSQVMNGLKALGITPHEIAEGEFEVGVLIPHSVVDQKLGSLVKELSDWNKIVRCYQEVAGEDHREVTVKSLVSGSYELYIPLGMVAARYLTKTIEAVMDLYLKVLEIRKRRLELEKLGAPFLETEGVQKHEKELLDKGIQALAKEIIKEAPKEGNANIEAHRKHEIETQLVKSITKIIRFVDKGGNVEVTSAQIESPQEPEDSETPTPDEAQAYTQSLEEFNRALAEFKKVEDIRKSGSSLRRLPERIEPILQIDSDLEMDGPENQHKKKADK